MATQWPPCGTPGAGNSGTFLPLGKHPAQIQSCLQSDGRGGKISRLFDRAVEGMNGDSPEKLFALLRRQFTVQSNGVSYRPQCRVPADQFERQWRGANQSCFLSGAASRASNINVADTYQFVPKFRKTIKR
jgi:hypothetical protein